MYAYSNSNTLGRTGKGVLGFIENIISNMSKTRTMSIVVPTAILHRTQLLCTYVEKQVGVAFGLENFLMVLYLGFIDQSIKKYEPLKIYKLISNSFGYNETFKIMSGNELIAEYQKRDGRRTEILISMDKEEIYKGELLLFELEELYGYKVSFNKMLANIWMDFIENYKAGDTNKALNDIIKMIKDTIKQQKH